MSEPIIIISQTCKFSQKLLEMINEGNLKYKTVELQNMPQIPSGLKSVPAIIFDSVSKPMEGKEVFNYIETQLNQRTKGKESGELDTFESSSSFSYIGGETSGQSQSFTFIDSKESTQPKAQNKSDMNLESYIAQRDLGIEIPRKRI